MVCYAPSDRGARWYTWGPATSGNAAVLGEMFKDFNDTKSPKLQAFLFSLKVLAAVIALSIIWEFAIEEWLFPSTQEDAKPESFEDHLEYILTVTAFTCIALFAPTVALYRYIERRNEADRQIRHMATHDALTGMPNRNLIFDRLGHAMRQAHRYKKRLAVLFIDLDGFKTVNDLLGHDAGDHVLQTVAARLKQGLRETDTVGRFGGDEFIAIITDVTDPDTVDAIIAKLKHHIAQHIEFADQHITLDASIGFAVYPDQAVTADDLIKFADQAMYEDKHNLPSLAQHSASA